MRKGFFMSVSEKPKVFQAFGFSLVGMMVALLIMSFLSLTLVQVMTSIFKDDAKNEDDFKEKLQGDLLTAVLTNDWSSAGPSLNNLKCTTAFPWACSDGYSTNASRSENHFFKYYQDKKKSNVLTFTLSRKQGEPFTQGGQSRHAFALLTRDRQVQGVKLVPVSKKIIQAPVRTGFAFEIPEDAKINVTKFNRLLKREDFFPQNKSMILLFNSVLVPSFKNSANYTTDHHRMPALLLSRSSGNFSVEKFLNIFENQKHFKALGYFYTGSNFEKDITQFIFSSPGVGGQSVFLFARKVNYILYRLDESGNLYRETGTKATSVEGSGSLLAEGICSIKWRRKMDSTLVEVSVETQEDGAC